MAGAPKKGEMKLLRINVSAKLYAYLTRLRRDTMLGGSETDVAAYLLTQRLEAMHAARYHETERIDDEPPAEE